MFSGTFFLFLDPFEILSHFPITDCSHWYREDVERIIDEIYKEELMINIASTLYSRTFLLNFGFRLFLLLFL